MKLSCDLVERDTTNNVTILTQIDVDSVNAAEFSEPDKFDEFMFDAIIEMLYVRAKYVQVNKNGWDDQSNHTIAVNNVISILETMNNMKYDTTYVKQYLNNKYRQ